MDVIYYRIVAFQLQNDELGAIGYRLTVKINSRSKSLKLCNR